MYQILPLRERSLLPLELMYKNLSTLLKSTLINISAINLILIRRIRSRIGLGINVDRDQKIICCIGGVETFLHKYCEDGC